MLIIWKLKHHVKSNHKNAQYFTSNYFALLRKVTPCCDGFSCAGASGDVICVLQILSLELPQNPLEPILGPLLFIIYINDWTESLSECLAKLYADDTGIVASDQDYLDIMISLKIEMSNVVEWLRLNKLTLNVEKTKLMIFGTSHKLKNIRYTCCI